MGRFSSVMLLLLLVLVATEIAPTVEQRLCNLPSGNFRGPCFRNANCASNCRDEGFPRGGACHNYGCDCFTPC